MERIAHRCRDLFKKVMVFAEARASRPGFVQDVTMAEPVKEYLGTVSGDESRVVCLLGKPTTRAVLLAKAVNYFLVGEVLKITAAGGFEDEVDACIGIGTATARTASVIQTATKRPEFADFSQQKARAHLLKLWGLIVPLTNDQRAGYGQTWTELAAIVSDAQTLAVDIFSLPLGYRMDFPQINDPFDPVTMVNRDSFIKGDPQALKNNGNRVGLAITPAIRIRELPGEESCLVYLAEVLLLPSPSGR
ncbi:hypothetical protein BO70DRAFT_133149 [Aspergillus heteromorphus CBS 117.55]|uniref:Uncharacterized protein n=1 Tax=Aspergillus heteromorphus CBS 117.55 TaxID=1448321 RepID=A0A317WUM1_9EURO|nr:uncharacterized protein BO70DRAFT_133149 [Aspergillus heteromorphus CBS 117.55]PWY90039.1 hypothetical protein BO70DRAFT_133149 [Aspergillus heteromorphus CBS 117.55]